MSLDYRERLITIFNHEEPDQLPLSIAPCPAFRDKLIKELGTYDLMKMGYTPELHLGIRGVAAGITDEFKRRGAVRHPYLHQGIGLLLDKDTLKDQWGVIRRVSASKTEGRIVYHPLKDAALDDLDDYPWPDPHNPTRYRASKEDVEKWKEQNYFIWGGFGGDAFWCQAWFLRGFNQLIVDMYSNPEFAKKLLDKLLGWYVGVAEHLAELGVDMIGMADDVATQTGMILAPDMWKKFIKPCYKKLYDSVRPEVKFISFHSDGDYEPIFLDLIDIGVTNLSMVQPDCLDMENLKRVYGDRLSILGGLSVQDTLPHGSVDEVKNEVKETIRICAPGGGFVLAASNCVTQDTPVENFLAVIEAAKKDGKYPKR